MHGCKRSRREPRWGDGVQLYVNGLLDRYSFNSKRVLNWITLSNAVQEAGVFIPQTPA